MALIDQLIRRGLAQAAVDETALFEELATTDPQTLALRDSLLEIERLRLVNGSNIELRGPKSVAALKGHG